MKKIIYKIAGMLMIVAILTTTGCQDQLTTGSSTEITGDQIFGSAEGLQKILRAAYKNFMFGELTYGAQEAGAYVGIPGFNLFFDDSSPDIMSTINYGMSPEDCYTFNPIRTQSARYADKIWRLYYNVINQTNTVLDYIDAAAGDDKTKAEIKGQALAIRGISYFYMVMCYQQTYSVAKDKRGVILRTSMIDPEQPANMGFSTVEQTYTRIVKDLTEAKSLLAKFDRGSDVSDKWKVNADVVSGMLARVYQVKGDWPNALAEASAVYAKYNTLMTQEQWYSGFCDISIPEVIWAVWNESQYNNGDNTIFCYWHNQDPSYGENMQDGPIFNFLALLVDQAYVDLFDATDYRGFRCDKTFKEGDPESNHVTDADEKGKVMFWHRTRAKAEWRDKWAYNKLKYYGDDGLGTKGQRNLADYSIMRASEMLLIKAEAQAHITPADAVKTLNELQIARKATLTTTTDQAELLEAIYIERRKELLGEGVTGMYDFVRLNKDMYRKVATTTNPAGHFDYGVTYMDKVDAETYVMPANDYRWFCQIPLVEMVNNSAITDSDQNPSKGQ